MIFTSELPANPPMVIRKALNTNLNGRVFNDFDFRSIYHSSQLFFLPTLSSLETEFDVFFLNCVNYDTFKSEGQFKCT